MTLHEYNNITYSDLIRKIDGFNERVRTNVALKRYQLWVTYIAPHLDPKKMAKTIDDLMPMPGEDNQPKQKVDEAKRNRLRAYLAAKNQKSNDTPNG